MSHQKARRRVVKRDRVDREELDKAELFQRGAGFFTPVLDAAAGLLGFYLFVFATHLPFTF